MVSTLIVRDVTLAVNGLPETRLDAGEFLRERVEVVSSFDQPTVEECFEVLQPVSGAEDAEPEVLEALMLLTLAHPEACAKFEASAVVAGRRLAGLLESRGQVERAVAILELLIERFPGNRSIERDLASLMRRRGKVEDLIERYLARANHLLKTGRGTEAIDYLREVLLLDRSRKDVARMIRDLRYQEVDEAKGSRRRKRTVFLVLSLSLALTLAVLRELRVRKAFESLPVADAADPDSQAARLTALELFVQRYPLWHGSLGAVAERTSLRVDLERNAQQRQAALERRRSEEVQRLELADMARERALLHVDSGEFEAALKEFQESLEVAPDGWTQRKRVERDVAAISAWLEDNR